MKNEQIKGNSLSESLLNKNVYYVLLTSREDSSLLRGDIALARKSFFEKGRKKVKAKRDTFRDGVEGKLQFKLKRRNLKWKRTESKVTTEECFKNRGIFTIASRDLNGSLISKISYNKNMLWIKTEYFGINDFVNAELIFKPIATENAIERFEYDKVKKNYVSTMLCPTPYEFSSELESIAASKLVGDMLLVSMEGGEYIYSTKEDIKEREKLLAEIKENGSVLGTVWATEIEEEIPAEEPKAEEPNEVKTETEEFPLDAEEKDIEEKPLPVKAKVEVDESEGADGSEAYGEKLIYTGTLIEGKRNGRGRTDRKSGLTAFDGEYLDNKRDGFGCSYYKNGNLSYAGFWKEDKKNGMGVSFRNSDHAVQITSWNDGKPESHTSIFDNEGYLKYTGNIKDGVKNGLCITYNKDEGGLFAGKWLQNGESGCGALFDSEGSLVYAGFLKDGKRHGQGTEFDKDGEIIFTGTFENDKYSKGTLYKKI